MEDSKFAELDSEQLQEINNLEEKIKVTLIAYDSKEIVNSTSNEMPSA